MSRFLLVDDSNFMRSILRNMLISEGHTVIGEASNGQMGVEEYKRLKPDIVTMDITMDQVDGLQALKQIIEFDPNAKVIMCSAMGQQCMVIDAIRYGAKDFIVKPFTRERVQEVLKKVIK